MTPQPRRRSPATPAHAGRSERGRARAALEPVARGPGGDRRVPRRATIVAASPCSSACCAPMAVFSTTTGRRRSRSSTTCPASSACRRCCSLTGLAVRRRNGSSRCASAAISASGDFDRQAADRSAGMAAPAVPSKAAPPPSSCARAEDKLREWRVMLPAVSTLERLVAAEVTHATTDLFDMMASRLPPSLARGDRSAGRSAGGRCPLQPVPAQGLPEIGQCRGDQG